MREQKRYKFKVGNRVRLEDEECLATVTELFGRGYAVLTDKGEHQIYPEDLLHLESDEVDPRDARIAELQAERDTLRQALGEIQSTTLMSSSMNAWQKCLAIADNAMNGEFVFPSKDELASMRQERDHATELLRAWADFDWQAPRSFQEWQSLVYSLVIHLQQYAAPTESEGK